MFGIAAGGMGIMALIAALFTIMQGVGAWERHGAHKGEMGVREKELGFKERQAMAATEASKRKYKVEKLGKERAWAETGKLAREQRGERREERGEARGMASADRQMAMMMAAVQALSQGGPQRDRNAPFSIVNLLRR